ncbi:MAG: fluoride efflux transporter CrcB [Acidobacteria bacterium]|nr:fluoride efflux transporter CrcB [Acidobacteriota bacterium]
MVMLGAAAGGLSRYALGTVITQRFSGRFPLGTVFVNVSGCFLIGVIMTVLTERLQPHPNWRLLLVVGGLGGYTTFSSFEYETYQAVRSGNHWSALLNVFVSVIVGYLGVWFGAFLARGR